MRKRISVLNGPNLNLTGEREPGIYGTEGLEQMNREIAAYAESIGLECVFFQSNSEGALIDRLHELRHSCAGIILNAGAYTHYSYALRDAVSAVRLPCVEVHLSNIFAREEFRKTSVLSPVCAGVISGFGKNSYILALDALKTILTYGVEKKA